MDNLPLFFEGGIIILFVHNRFYKKKKEVSVHLSEGGGKNTTGALGI